MLLQRIKAANYRTYLDLDLDLRVDPDKPLVVIGGANGGGKTTLFNAIAGALYGLRIPDAETFRKEVNAGAMAAGTAELTITLELWFTGQILAQQQQYVLTRTWTLASDARVNWGVKLNMAGNVLAYGSATADKERLQSEAQVNKIIKANLPKELSQYFLFDAMSAGEKLSDDQLGKVIRENIENVMGLRKYLDLGSAARVVQESWKADRMKAKAEREEYIGLTEQQRREETRLRELQEQRDDLLGEIQATKDLVAELQVSRDQEGTLKHRLEGLEKQKRETAVKELQYRSQLDEFVKGLELSIGLPHLVGKMRIELERILAAIRSSSGGFEGSVDPQRVRNLVGQVWELLQKRGISLAGIAQDEIVALLIKPDGGNSAEEAYAWLDPLERKALEDLIGTHMGNPFPALDMVRQELSHAVAAQPAAEAQAEELRQRLAGKDYSSLQKFENLEKRSRTMETELEELRITLAERARRIHQYDLTPLDEPDPRYDAACRLKAWFEDAADELHKAKKLRIENRLRDDLNQNLAAYRNVIDRVELSESLRNLTFRIFHKAGNEIYLGQLNAASKQVVIQVLLKALHESGDYDPPVMIDTVMGVLDRESRSIILQNYFPSLSHQTILLSTDSEIDPERDWKQIEPFVGKAWTLVRDREAQRTEVVQGYFGNTVEAT